MVEASAAQGMDDEKKRGVCCRPAAGRAQRASARGVALRNCDIVAVVVILGILGDVKYHQMSKASAASAASTASVVVDTLRTKSCVQSFSPPGRSFRLRRRNNIGPGHPTFYSANFAIVPFWRAERPPQSWPHLPASNGASRTLLQKNTPHALYRENSPLNIDVDTIRHDTPRHPPGTPITAPSFVSDKPPFFLTSLPSFTPWPPQRRPSST